jgi:hypothetical protein
MERISELQLVSNATIFFKCVQFFPEFLKTLSAVHLTECLISMKQGAKCLRRVLPAQTELVVVTPGRHCTDIA